MFEDIRKKAEKELSQKRKSLGASEPSKKKKENAQPRKNKYITLNTTETSELGMVDKKLSELGKNLSSTSMNKNNSSGVESSWETYLETFDTPIRVIQKTNTYINDSKTNPQLKSVSESQMNQILMSHLTAFYKHINAEFKKKNGVDMLTTFIATGGVKLTDAQKKALQESISKM